MHSVCDQCKKLQSWCFNTKLHLYVGRVINVIVNSGIKFIYNLLCFKSKVIKLLKLKLEWYKTKIKLLF